MGDGEMVRHVVAFRFKPDATQADRQRINDGLEKLSGEIEEIRRYVFGPDLGLAEGNFDFVVVADFDDQAAYGRYAANDAHQTLIREAIRPVISERVAVQYEINEA